MAINLGSTIIDLINEINSKGSVTIDSIDGLKGGTLKSPITFKGGDAATASKAILDQNNQGQVTDTSTATLLGFNSAKEFLVGSNSYKTVIRGNSNSTIGDKKISDLAVKSDIPNVYDTLYSYLYDDTVNQVIYWDADNQEFTSTDITELETKVVGNPTSGAAVATLTRIQIGDKVYSVADVTNGCVKLTGDQTIDGVKTFKAPTNVSGSETTTTKFKTSNGGAVIIGKEGANSGTMLRLDQVDGTCRLRFRSSATAGAMVWEQPEKNASLYFDLGNAAGTGKNRITMPNANGTLALTSQLPAVVSANPTLSGSETELTGLKIGSTSYKLPSGDVTAAGNNTFSGANTFSQIVSSSAGFSVMEDGTSANSASLKYRALEWHLNDTVYRLSFPTNSGTIALRSEIDTAINTAVGNINESLTTLDTGGGV